MISYESIWTNHINLSCKYSHQPPRPPQSVESLSHHICTFQWSLCKYCKILVKLSFGLMILLSRRLCVFCINFCTCVTCFSSLTWRYDFHLLLNYLTLLSSGFLWSQLWYWMVLLRQSHLVIIVALKLFSKEGSSLTRISSDKWLKWILRKS